jgi:hypothetical protein
MHNQNGLRRLLSAILLFVLIHEWMRPLSELSSWTDVYSVEPLLLTIAGILAVDVLSIPLIWAWAVKLLITLSSVAAMFHGANLLHMDWWIDFSGLIYNDAVFILLVQWGSVSAESRTLLFIGAWTTVICWLYVCILYHWVALYVTIVTIAYLLTLQIWLGLDTNQGIIHTVIAGLLLHGLSVLPVLERMYGLRMKSSGWPMTWMVSSILVVSLIVGSGLLFAAKQDRTALRLASIQSKSMEALHLISLPHLNGYNGESKRDVERRAGYGSDDSTLGGSIRSDESIAFFAITGHPNAYWRGESKAMYDGTGWKSLSNDLYGYEIGSTLPDVLADSGAADSYRHHPIMIQEIFPIHSYEDNRGKDAVPLLASGAIRRVDHILTEKGAAITEGIVTVDRVEGKYILQGSQGESDLLSSYRVVSSIPVTSQNLNVMMVGPDTEEQQNIPAAISVPYLQLPEHLPQRIAQLTRSITDDSTTTWEKAKAVEQYLREHYRYTLTPNNPVRTGNSDFVDMFLFEQKEGYCDYFSTAMTVMLRSIGVPARWVKGFSPGEIIEPDENEILLERMQTLRSERNHSSNNTYYSILVRHRNAHSWVEVYLPEIGWISFDPTPGSSSDSTTRLQEVSVAGSGITAAGVRLREHILNTGSNIRSTIPIRWLKLSLLVFGMIMVASLLVVILSRSQKIQQWYQGIHIRLRLFLYARGIGSHQTDKLLLERILNHTLLRYRHRIRVDETVRESIARNSSLPVILMQPLQQLVLLYEQARYGPPSRKRTPYYSIRLLWKEIRIR